MAERWSEEDSAQHKERIAYADLRLEGWARWSGQASPELIGFAGVSTIVSAMMPTDEEKQAGARHLAQECSDDEAMQVDAVLADWKSSHRGWWKVARKEFLTYGPSEKKARELGLNRAEYRKQLDLLRMAMWKELDPGARNGKKARKLDALPRRQIQTR